MPPPSGIIHTSFPLQMVVNKKGHLKMLTEFRPANASFHDLHAFGGDVSMFCFNASEHINLT